MTPEQNPRNPKWPPQKVGSSETGEPERIIEFDFDARRQADRLKRFAEPSEAARKAGVPIPDPTVRRVESPNAQKPSNPANPMQNLSPNPTISEFRRNAERQRREQQSTSTLLSTTAYIFLGSLVLVAALAGFGGYTLWKQIKNQSVTITQLEAKFDGQVSALNQEL